jgi:hypothetical protein
MIEPIYWTGNVHDSQQSILQDWRSFTELWNNLPLDGYMADHGTYRRRKYVSISYEQLSQRIQVSNSAAFLQSKEINPLNGGVARAFTPVDAELLEMPVTTQLLAHFAARAGGPTAGSRMVNVHQHRISATGSEPGKPTPEGIHRDGVEYIVMMLVARHNVTGGTSTLYDNSRKPVFTHTLSEPGDYIFLDDRTCLHSVSPVTVAPSATAGHRDMFFLEFC